MSQIEMATGGLGKFADVTKLQNVKPKWQRVRNGARCVVAVSNCATRKRPRDAVFWGLIRIGEAFAVE